MKKVSLNTIISLALCASLLLGLMPLTGCAGGSSGSADAATATTTALTTAADSTSKLRSSSMQTVDGFTMGVVYSAAGGQGQSDLYVDVPQGAKCLNIGPSSALTGPSTLSGVTVTVYGPDNRVMGSITEGTADTSRLSLLPEPSAALAKAFSDEGSGAAASLSEAEKSLVSALSTDSAGQTSTELQKEVDSYLAGLSAVSNAGTASRSDRSAALQNYLTIMNPTAGSWRIAVTAASSSTTFDLVAMVIPSSGMTSSDNIAKVVTVLQNDTGWTGSSMFTEAGITGEASSRDDSSYWLYDTLFWLVKSVVKPSIATTVLTYIIVFTYPPASSHFSEIKKAIASIIDTVIQAVGSSNVESFRNKVAHLLARAICKIFKMPYRELSLSCRAVAAGGCSLQSWRIRWSWVMVRQCAA